MPGRKPGDLGENPNPLTNVPVVQRQRQMAKNHCVAGSNPVRDTASSLSRICAVRVHNPGGNRDGS
jgi:hypothetical protein